VSPAASLAAEPVDDRAAEPGEAARRSSGEFPSGSPSPLRSETLEPEASLSAAVAARLREAAGGSRGAIARLLSVVERGGPAARALAREVDSGEREPETIGITGAPGAGKSTLTSALVRRVREEGRRVAVLAIDPSSPFSGGAILGDRVRMQSHAGDPEVFIRSLASRGHLGGLAAAVPEAVRLFGAVGFPVVVVETVGVGQVEVDVAGATDTTVVVVTPGWGDAVQANKAGLLEVADLFVVNKADRPGAREARRDLEAMLELSGSLPWRPPVIETVATDGSGVEELWAAIGRHRAYLEESGAGLRRRAARREAEAARLAMAQLQAALAAVLAEPFGEELRVALADGRLDVRTAADRLVARVQAARMPEAGGFPVGGGPRPGDCRGA